MLCGWRDFADAVGLRTLRWEMVLDYPGRPRSSLGSL